MMKTTWSNKIDNILKVGIFLEDIGVNNWALTKQQALHVLDQFISSEIPVLGGDVYEEIDGIIQSNYDSWHCDPVAEETNREFLERSIKCSINYIEKYNSNNWDKIFFVLVPMN